MGLASLEHRFEKPYNLYKLPKWAQAYIEALKREVEKQMDTVAEVTESLPKGSIYYRGTFEADPVYLSDHVEVVFEFEERSRIRVHKNSQTGRIDVSGDGRIEVRPHASNAISVVPV